MLALTVLDQMQNYVTEDEELQRILPIVEFVLKKFPETITFY